MLGSEAAGFGGAKLMLGGSAGTPGPRLGASLVVASSVLDGGRGRAPGVQSTLCVEAAS